MSNSCRWGTISSCSSWGSADRLRDGLEPLGILDVHALGPLKEGEVAKRCLAERHQLDADTGGIGVSGHREVRSGQAWGRADSREQVLDERQVEHLLVVIARSVLRQRWTAARESWVRPSSRTA